MKIRTRLIVTAVIALIPMWIGIISITLMARASDREKTIALMDEYAAAMTASVSSFFDDAIDAARYLATLLSDDMKEWAGQRGAGQLFVKFIRLKDTIQLLALVDSSGYMYEARQMGNSGNPWQGGRRTVDDLDPNAAPLSIADRDYFRELVTDNNRGTFRVIVSEPYIPQGLSAKYFLVSAPIIVNRRAIGIVNAAQTSGELSRLYVELAAGLADKFGNSAHLFLVSAGGQLVSHLEFNEEEDGYIDSLANRAELLYLNEIETDTAQALQAAMSSDEVITATMQGATYFFISSKIEGTPLTVCLAADEGTMLVSSQRMFVVANVIFWLMTALMVAGMYSATKAIVSSLKRMDSTMRDIAKDWDLTAQVEIKGNDEIADIGESINQFVAAINEMIGRVSKSAEAMSSVAEALSGDTESISGDVSIITKDIENLNFVVEEQSTSVTETSATIAQIVQNIESLTRQIENQSAAVTQSSASVSQMVANVNAISGNVSKASSHVGSLKAQAVNGRESINAVQNLVNKLSTQSDSLLEANSVIDNIAAQTNLLAMNASIEAAHAGEAGKGFSVVASEIRKLAEDSAKQSEAIAAGLKATIASIKDIAAATTTADGAFEGVAAKITDVVGLAEEIDHAMIEQNTGGQQVLEALRDIENVTMQIRDGAVEMNMGAEAILKEMNRLSSVSRQVQDHSTSIADASDAITGAVSAIVDASGANKEAIEVLIGITGRFVL